MFPTLEADQEYTFKVEARDSQGNKSTFSKTFSLAQKNLVMADPVSVMAVAKSLLDSHDQPLGTVVFRGAHGWRHPKPWAPSRLYHPA